MKLQQIIKEDTDGIDTEATNIENNKFNINKGENAFKYSQYNDNLNDVNEVNEDNLLVHRPLKNFVWGLGQKAKQKKCKNTFYKFY